MPKVILGWPYSHITYDEEGCIIIKKENKMSDCDKVDLTKYKRWVRPGDRVSMYFEEYLVVNSAGSRFLHSLRNGNKWAEPYLPPDIENYKTTDSYTPLCFLLGRRNDDTSERIEIVRRSTPNIPLDYIPPEARKPMSRGSLKFKDVTPGIDYYKWQSGGQVRRIDGKTWQDKYRLVEFQITGVQSRETFQSDNIHWHRPWNDITSHMQTCGTLYLSCLRDLWSAPVVIPIDFYEKLPCYVEDFNKKLNNCGD